jgi:hypothetical protein
VLDQISGHRNFDLAFGTFEEEAKIASQVAASHGVQLHHRAP